MKNEKVRENGCKIFCIFFKRETESGRNQHGEKTLKEIAKLGETGDIYNPNSLMGLCNVFNQIAEIIQTNYKLKLNKKV